MDDQINIEMNTLAKQKKMAEETTMDMRAHLTGLQNWDLAEGQTIEERRAEHAQFLIEKQRELNEKLMKKSRRWWPFSKAKKTAEGQPVQKQAPAKKTFKQKREDKRLDQVAKEKTPVADHVSMRMMEGLKENRSMRENSMGLLTKEQRDRIERGEVDGRVLKAFVFGYEKNKKGKPASELDEERRKADVRFLNEYMSKDVKLRRPHLNRMLEQVLSIQITEDMMTTEYVEGHMGELREQIDMMVYFQNVYNDPVNKPFFDALPKITKDLIEYRVLARYVVYGDMLTHICATKAFDSNHFRLMTNVTDQSKLQVFHEMVDYEKETLHEQQVHYRQAEQETLKQYVDQKMEENRVILLEDAAEMKEEAETAIGDIGGLGLTSYVTGYSLDELANYRKMIEEHPAEYAKNPKLIDALYQGMHHAMDALGDVTLRIMAAQQVTDDVKNHSSRLMVTDRLIIDIAEQEQNKASAEADLIRGQFSAHADAMLALLRGKPLSDPAKELLRRMGHQV